MTGRRTTLLLAMQALGGCGFHPLLAPSKGTTPSAAAELRAVFVPSMAERSGQLFRAALQAKLEASGGAATKRYELVAPLAIAFDQSAIQRDNSVSRLTLAGSSSWSLLGLTPARPLLISGNARVLDGYDRINEQYLAGEFANEDAYRRVTRVLAEQIVQQLAAYFDGLSRA